MEARHGLRSPPQAPGHPKVEDVPLSATRKPRGSDIQLETTWRSPGGLVTVVESKKTVDTLRYFGITVTSEQEQKKPPRLQRRPSVMVGTVGLGQRWAHGKG